MMQDNVHPLVSIPSKISISNFMGYLKVKNTLIMIYQHANLKYKFGNRYFRSEGYCVCMVGLKKITAKRYIRDQENMIGGIDKLNVKEYEVSFKGSGK